MVSVFCNLMISKSNNGPENTPAPLDTVIILIALVYKPIPPIHLTRQNTHNVY